MTCISKILIQKYLDNELSGKEKARVEKHINACEICSALLMKQQQSAHMAKKALNTLVPDEIMVPVFTSNTKPAIGHVLSLRKKIIYSISAACLAILVAGVCYTLQVKKTDKVYMMNSPVPEVNANLPVSEQEMIINVIDPEGNVTECPLR